MKTINKNMFGTLAFAAVFLCALQGQAMQADLKKLNESFHLDLKAEDLGNILYYSVPSLDTDFQVVGRLSPLTALSRFADIETLKHLMHAFERQSQNLRGDALRLDEEAFYDGLMLGIMAREYREKDLFGVMSQRSLEKHRLPLLIQNAVRHLLIVGDLTLLDKFAHTKPFEGFMNHRTLNPVIMALFLDLMKYSGQERYLDAMSGFKNLMKFYSSNDLLRDNKTYPRSNFVLNNVLKAIEAEAKSNFVNEQYMKRRINEIVFGPLTQLWKEVCDQNREQKDEVQASSAARILIEDRRFCERGREGRTDRVLDSVEARVKAGRALASEKAQQLLRRPSAPTPPKAAPLQAAPLQAAPPQAVAIVPVADARLTIERDLNAVNTEFGINLNYETIGLIMKQGSLLKELEVNIDGHTRLQNLNPLAYLAFNGDVATLTRLVARFEAAAAKLGEEERRTMRAIFYETLLWALELQKKWGVIHALIAADSSDTKISAVSIARRFALVLMESENSHVLKRMHDPDQNPKPSHSGQGSRYTDLHLVQPLLASYFNREDIGVFVARDILENLVKKKGKESEADAKDVIRFYIDFYSDMNALPVKRELWIGSTYAFDAKARLLRELKRFPNERDFILKTVESIYASLLPAAEPAEVAEAMPAPSKKREQPEEEVLMPSPSADEPSSAKKQAKTEVFTAENCSPLAVLILNKMRDELIEFEFGVTQPGDVCIVNGEPLSTASLLLKVGKIDLLMKLCRSGKACGLDVGVLFDKLVSERRVPALNALLSDIRLYGDAQVKEKLLDGVVKAYEDNVLSQDEFEQVIGAEGVFAEGALMGAGQIKLSDELISRILENRDAVFVKTFLSNQALVSKGQANLFAYKEFVKALASGNNAMLKYWIDSGLLDLNGAEYPLL